MSISQEVFNTLIDMGIGLTLAHEAASRYHNAGPAVDWCFGDGANWTAESQVTHGQSSKSSTSIHNIDTPVEQQEACSDTLIPSPRPPEILLQSNNPFLTTQNSGKSANSPVPQYQIAEHQVQSEPNSIDQIQKNDDLAQAIALSQQTAANTEPLNYQDEKRGQKQGLGPNSNDCDEKGNRQERNLRAGGAPPPSPQNEEIVPSYFGPSNKNNHDGSMSLVPSQNQNGNDVASKEDADLDKAIQESLMTASFHSASNVKDQKTIVPSKREEKAPLVFFSQSGDYTYAAHLLQAFVTIPEFCKRIQSALSPPCSEFAKNRGVLLNELLQAAETETNSFMFVDEHINTLYKDSTMGSGVRNPLPPADAAINFQSLLIDFWKDLVNESVETEAKSAEEAVQRTKDSQRLFETCLFHAPTTHPTFVNFNNAPPHNNVHSQLAAIFWGNQDKSLSTSTPNVDDAGGMEGVMAISEPSDVLTVMIHADGRIGNGEREQWQLDEEIVLDRFLYENAAWTANRRGLQAISLGNARRTQEKIDRLTLHEGHDYLESLQTAIKHLESTIANKSTCSKADQREMMKIKLETTHQIISAKVDVLRKDLDEYKKEAGDKVFEVDDPAMKKHVYTLSAVLMYDGNVIGSKHLYMYLKHEDHWWKIIEHEAEKVNWEDIKGDKTGLWLDGGAYLLLYNRISPRVIPQLIPDNSTSSCSQVNIQAGQVALPTTTDPSESTSPPALSTPGSSSEPTTTSFCNQNTSKSQTDQPDLDKATGADLIDLSGMTPSTEEDMWIEDSNARSVVALQEKNEESNKLKKDKGDDDTAMF
ncbi:hypothetical protein L204_100640 [Cryptococcus depauperatus]